MSDFLFMPDRIEIYPGTTVRWTNLDIALHNSVSLEGAWDSGLLALGESFSLLFEDEGFHQYDYECTLHGGMTGSVVLLVPEPTSLVGLVALAASGRWMRNPRRRPSSTRARNRI
jgi:hypothetical protein